MKSWENKVITESEKQHIIDEAEKLFAKVLTLYGWDIKTDPNMIETPRRIAKSWFEIFRGSFNPAPKLTSFPIKDMDYPITKDAREIKSIPVFVGPMKIYSMCSHHFLPIIGFAYVEYRFTNTEAGGTVIGLSKIPRMVKWISRRPAIQEKLTEQIVKNIEKITHSRQVYARVEAKHLCAAMRGAEEDNALMVTEYFDGYNEEMLEGVRGRVASVRKDVTI